MRKKKGSRAQAHHTIILGRCSFEEVRIDTSVVGSFVNIPRLPIAPLPRFRFRSCRRRQRCRWPPHTRRFYHHNWVKPIGHALIKGIDARVVLHQVDDDDVNDGHLLKLIDRDREESETKDPHIAARHRPSRAS